MASKFVNIEGARFGRLVVQGVSGKKDGKFVWNCLCDCGNYREVLGTNLRSGVTQSCGCYMKDQVKKANTKHGHSKDYQLSREYNTYTGMVQRCTNSKHIAYHNYGGRGIGVSDEWLKGFKYFLADMGHRPKGTELDRIDNNKGYSKANCRWVTVKENGRNKRNNLVITFNGITKTLTEWAEVLGMGKDTLHHRLSSGWTVERALTTKVRKYNVEKLAGVTT